MFGEKRAREIIIRGKGENCIKNGGKGIKIGDLFGL